MVRGEWRPDRLPERLRCRSQAQRSCRHFVGQSKIRDRLQDCGETLSVAELFEDLEAFRGQRLGCLGITVLLRRASE